MLPKYLIMSAVLATVAVVTEADVFDQMDEFWHNMDQQFEKLDNEMDKIFENSDWDKPPFYAAEQGTVYQVIVRLDGILESEVKVNTYGNVVVINAVHEEPDMRRQFHHTQVIPPAYKTTGRWKFKAPRLTLMFDKVSTNGSSAAGTYHNTGYAGTNRNSYRPPIGHQTSNLPGKFHSTGNSHISPAESSGMQSNIHQTEQGQTGSGSSTIPYGRVPINRGTTSGLYPQGQIHSTGGQVEQVGSGEATSVNKGAQAGEQNSNIGSGSPSREQSSNTGSGYASRPRQQSGGQGSNHGAEYSAGGYGSNNGAGHSSAGQGSNHGAGYPAGGYRSNNGAGHSSAGQGSSHGAGYPAGEYGSNNGAGHSSPGQGSNHGAGYPAGGYGSNNGAGHSSAGQDSNHGAGYPAGGYGSNNGAGHSSAGQGSYYGSRFPAGVQVLDNGAQYSSAGQGRNYGAGQPSSNVNGVTEQTGQQGENVTPKVYRSSSHQRRSGEGFVQGDPNTYRQWETARSNAQARYHIDSDGQVIPLGQGETLTDGFRVSESRKQFHSVSETHTVDRAPETSSTGNAGSSIGGSDGDSSSQHSTSGRLRNGKIYTTESYRQDQKY